MDPHNVTAWFFPRTDTSLRIFQSLSIKYVQAACVPAESDSPEKEKRENQRLLTPLIVDDTCNRCKRCLCMSRVMLSVKTSINTKSMSAKFYSVYIESREE